MSRRVYIQTVGCQMNVLDSELVAAGLLQAGHELVDSQRQADTILFNTCSVRQHAEDKIYSALGRLKHLKDRRPQTIIGVLGCMAQKDQQQILKRAPHVDLVVGPGQLSRLPEMLAQIAAGQRPRVEVELAAGQQLLPSPLVGEGSGVRGRRDQNAKSPSYGRVDRQDALPLVELTLPQRDLPRTAQVRPLPHQAMVRIMFGCNKPCTYCIVPRVRGPEQSRPAVEIESEVRRLADDGCLEVTLLGQTVNSYRDNTGGRTVRLADLLYRLDGITGLRRLKFVTNHPRHITAELLQAVRDLPRVSPYLHVPAQSGSNRVLRRMRRGYTLESYREMLAAIRETVPGAAITSDFIVGFCGESDEDFAATIELVRDARFKNSFIFKYSPRPGTPAAELYADDVPEAVKRRRNNELLAVQNAISLEDNQPFLGRTVAILVEGPSKRSRKQAVGFSSGSNGAPGDAVQLVGRTVCDRIVVFPGRSEHVGRVLPVLVEKVDAFTLFAKPPAAVF